MHTLLHDMRVSARSLIARPGFSAVAILTLALGVGATTALFSVVNGILLKSLPYLEPDRLVTLWQTPRDTPTPRAVSGSVAHLNYLDWKREAKSFDAMALYSGATFTVTGLGDAEVVPGAVVTPDFFSVFRASLVGREFTRDDDRPNGPRVVVVSHAFWKDRLGGRENAVGTTIEISGRSTEIVGIAPAGFDFPNGARLWQPVQNDDASCGRGCVYLNGIARLAPGATLESARQEMQAIGARLEQQFSEANTNITIGVTSLADQLVGDVRRALLMLLGAVTMVLLIACANVASLLLVRGTARQGELAIRAALGASYGRMIRFMLTESALLALAGSALGLLLSVWGVDALKRAAPANLPRLDEVGVDGATFAFAIALAVVTAVLFGLGPALQIARAPVASLIGTRGAVGTRRTQRSRSALLVAEVALSFMLLVGAGLLLRSMVRLQAIDPGWNSAGISIFTIALPTSRYPQATDVTRTFDELDDRLEALPGVERVARINGLPLGPSINVLSFRRPDRPEPPPGQEPSSLFRMVDEDYFRTAGIPLLSGRTFGPGDTAGGQPVAVISRELAEELWRGEDPIGKQVQFSSTVRTIVGVVAGVRSTNVAEPPQPELYVPLEQVGARSATFLVRSTLPQAQVLNSAREVVRGIDARLPLIRPGTWSALEDQALARQRFLAVLLGMFAMLAVALAAVGMYGVVAYAVSQRSKEIGVRITLGAERADVMRLVLWQGLKPAAAGILAGLAGALAATRVMTHLLYEVAPRDPAILGGVVVLLLSVVAVACAVPAYRATRIPPATALRSE